MIQLPLAPNIGARLLALAHARVGERAAGGPGSGNFGHTGRPGEVGGSGEAVLTHVRTRGGEKFFELKSDVGKVGLVQKPDSDHLWITRSHVEEEERGKGHAVRLYERAIGEAKKMGLKGIASSSAHRTEAADHVWQSLERRGHKITTTAGSQYLTALGGPGSGNFGHAGRPGEVGGSSGDSIPSEHLDLGHDLVVHATKSGVEEGAGIDENGKEIGRSSGEAEAVDLPTGPWNDRKRSLTWHHTHPFEASFSLGDMVSMAQKDGMATMYAHTPTRSYAVEAIPEKRRELFDVARDVFANHQQTMAVDPFIDGKINKKQAKQASIESQHAAMLDLAKRGLVKYRWTDRAPRAAGGPGSGNFGHRGRPGEIGGSATSNDGDDDGLQDSFSHTLRETFPELNSFYRMDSDTSHGSIGAHTRRVEWGWKKQITQDELKDISGRYGADVGELMDHVVALHDIGKGDAVEQGDKSLQHTITPVVMSQVLRELGFSERDVLLAQELVNHDLLGKIVQYNKDPAKAVDAMHHKAKLVGMDVHDFTTLQLALYHADAGAYDSVRKPHMTRGEDGKLSFRYKHDRLRDIKALGQHDESVNTESSQIGRHGWEHRAGRANGRTRAVIERLNTIRLGQQSSDPDLRDAGGPGSGNFGHGGRPGEVGGSSAKLEKLESEHGEMIPSAKIFKGHDVNNEIIAMYHEMDTSRNGTYEHIDPSTLHTTQEEVDVTGLKHYLAGTGRSQEEPIVVKYRGKKYIVEGHHRTGAAILKGEKKLKVEVYDGDKFTAEWESKHLGGPGSGNFGHGGRPGEVGGSSNDKGWEAGEGVSDSDVADAAIAWTAERYPKLALTEKKRSGLESRDRTYIGATVDGLTVRTHIPNTDSIGATFYDENEYNELPGIREVAIDDFNLQDFRAGDDTAKVDAIAAAIADSGEISPLIVVMDGSKKPYVLEGGHRVLALKKLGKKKMPAVVIVDHTALKTAGGPGSGNFGHAGRPGEIGGSSSDNETSTEGWARRSKVIEGLKKELSETTHSMDRKSVREEIDRINDEQEAHEERERQQHLSEERDDKQVKLDANGFLADDVVRTNDMVPDHIAFRQQQLRDDGDDYHGDLDHDTRITLQHYTGGAHGYYNANADTPGYDRGDEVAAIQTAILDAPEPDGPVLTYRGITIDSDRAEKMFPIGTTIEMKGFQSTSFSPEKAAMFLASSGAVTGSMHLDRGTMLEIQAVRGLHLGGGEDEFLLPHGSHFQIVGFKDVDFDVKDTPHGPKGQKMRRRIIQIRQVDRDDYPTGKVDADDDDEDEDDDDY